MQWISVDDRLPETAGFYLVLRLTNPYPTTRRYFSDLGWISQDTVLYWMPLPAYPEHYYEQSECSAALTVPRD